MKSRIIFINDEECVWKSHNGDIHRSDVEAAHFTRTKDALNHMRRHQIDIAICDSDLKEPNMSSIAFFKKIQLVYPDVCRVMLSDGKEDVKIKLGLITGTVEHCLSKSCDLHALLAYLKKFADGALRSAA